MKVIKDKRIYTGESVIENGFVRFGEKIEEVGPMESFQAREDDEILEVEGQNLIPGFIDIHSHGGYGKDSMDASPEEIDFMVSEMAKEEGITSYFCTTMTQSYEKIEKAMENIALAAEKNPIIQGIHVEGPFVSADYKGAQSEEFIKKPDAEALKKWNEISGNRIRVVTYAPEEADEAFETWCVENKIVLSAGHSKATYEICNKSQASHVTHMYNAQRGLNHREPGVTGFGMLNDSARAEMIVDGLHIVPDMVKLAFKVKGADGIELITDSMRAKGMPDGVSELGGQTVYVKEGAARLENGTLAGSVLKYIDAFRNIRKFAGASVEDAVKMTSVNQAKEFGLEQKGGIAAGKDADLLVLGQEEALQAVFTLGRRVK